MTAQNTTLTLRGRPFLFAGDIQLVRGQSKEVDISSLSPSQLKTLKKYVDSGHLESTMDLECSEANYSCELKAKPEEEGEESDDEEEALEEASLQEGPEELRSMSEEPSLEVSEEDDEAEPEEDEGEEAKELRTKYNKMRVTELKKEVKRLQIDTEATTKKELVKVLVAHGLAS